MKQLLLICAFFSFLCLANCVQNASSQARQNQNQPNLVDRVREELIRLHTEWREARKRGDVKTMDRITHDDWSLMRFDGNMVTKSGSFVAADTGMFKDSIIKPLENVSVRLYGDTALMEYYYQGPQGSTYVKQVWIKEAGKWKWVAGQETLNVGEGTQ